MVEVVGEKWVLEEKGGEPDVPGSELLRKARGGKKPPICHVCAGREEMS